LQAGGRAILACLFLAAIVSRTSAQSWAAGYPKLQFGAAALSDTVSFPELLGAAVPQGGLPQDVILRFKASDDASAAHFTAGRVSIELQLSSFSGGDNAWSRASASVKLIQISAGGILSPISDRLASGEAAVTWRAAASTLTVMLEVVEANEIKDSELALVLAASSFVQGKGPIAPRCLERDAPLYVKQFMSGATVVAGFHGVFKLVAPIGCFGNAERPFNVASNSWVAKRIGQSAFKNGVGMDVTITVTLASSLDFYSVTEQVKSEIHISGLLGSQTSDTNALPIDVHGTQFFSARDLFSTNADNEGNWKQDTGTLILPLKDGRMLPASVPFVFSFKLKLPAAPLALVPKVLVMAKTGTMTVIAQETMDSAAGDAAPLSTRKRMFIAAKIGQLISGGGQENTISVTVMSNYDIQSTTSYVSKITISGLTGSVSRDSSQEYRYPVVPASKDSVQGIFSDGTALDSAAWSKTKGEIVLEIVNGRFLRAGTEYVFSIALLNQVEPTSSSPKIYIQASGETDTGRIEMQRGEGREAPMFISSPTMSIAKVLLFDFVWVVLFWLLVCSRHQPVRITCATASQRSLPTFA
jgi:hypothetical protein